MVMSSNKYLASIYKLLFEEEFTGRTFEQRLKLQKGIYMLQELGVPVGDYGFSWYKHGPYSQSLLGDIYKKSDVVVEKSKLSKRSLEQFNRLKNAFSEFKNTKYTMEKWVECIASIHYLKERIVHCGANPDEVIKELVERKPHLNDEDSNTKAYELEVELFSCNYMT